MFRYDDAAEICFSVFEIIPICSYYSFERKCANTNVSAVSAQFSLLDKLLILVIITCSTQTGFEM